MNFGKYIKKARTEAGLTQEQLGVSCGWNTGNPQSRIGNYEKGVRSPSAADLAIIAKTLNKGILYFYEGEELPVSAAKPKAQYSNPSNSLSEIITNDTPEVIILRDVINRVEQILLDEQMTLTPEQKARVIIACLHATLKSENAVDTTHISTAIRAVI